MKPGVAAAVVLFVGAVLIGFGSISKGWVRGGEEDIKISAGLRSLEVCGGEEGCETDSYLKHLDHAKGQQLLMALSGLAAFLAGLAGAVLAIIAGAMVLSGKSPRTLALIATIIAGVALLFAFVFMASTDKPRGLSWSYACFLFIVGAIATLVGGILARGKGSPGMRPVPGMAMGMPGGQMPYMGQPMQPMPGQPMQSPMMQPPMPTQAPPSTPCPTCRNPLQFVAQYQRWFCVTCNRYL